MRSTIIDPEFIESKPRQSEIGKINNRLLCTELAAEELALSCVNGHTFCPGVMEGGRSRNNWKEQQYFALDFDKDITINEFLRIALDYDVIPAFVYTTFSHTTEHHKFRAVFVFDEKIIHDKVAYLILHSLHYIFNKKSDKKCLDISRIFFPGRYIEFENYESTIGFEIVRKVCEKLKADDRANFKRNIKLFCKDTNLNLNENGLPAVEYFDNLSGQLIENGNDEQLDSQLIYISTNTNNSSNIVLNFSGPEVSNSRSKSIRQRTQNSNTKENIRIKSIENCSLLKAATAGQHFPSYSERLHINMNLVPFRNGKAVLKDVYQNFDDEKYASIKTQIKIQGDYYYNPSTCTTDRCPFYDSCEKVGSNIQHQIYLQRREILEVDCQKNYYSLEHIQDEIYRQLDNAINPQHKVTLIKAPTGSGKSQSYINLPFFNKKVGIFAPNHNVLAEISERLTAAGKSHLYIKKLELSPALEKIYYKLCNAGYAKKALKIIHEMAEDEDKVRLKEYSRLLKKAKKADTVLATHRRLLTSDISKNLDLIIIDEDIIKRDYIEVVNLPVSHLRKVYVHLKYDPSPAVKLIAEKIGTFLKEISLLQNEEVELSSFNFPGSKELAFALETTGFFNSQMSEINDAVSWLDDDKVIIRSDKKGNQEIVYGKKHKLPDIKTIILSATANNTIYKQIFGDNLKIVHVGEAKLTGKLIIFFDETYSRQSLRRLINKRQLREIFKEVYDKNMYVITFKKFVKNFQEAGFNVIGNFGNLEGLDQYSGQDIAIIGTPHVHPVAIRTIARLIGYQYDDEDFASSSMQEERIRRNGYDFSFYVYKNRNLREVQLWLIESELEQAVGRARLLRNNNIVHVYSNFALPQSQIYSAA